MRLSDVPFQIRNTLICPSQVTRDQKLTIHKTFAKSHEKGERN